MCLSVPVPAANRTLALVHTQYKLAWNQLCRGHAHGCSRSTPDQKCLSRATHALHTPASRLGTPRAARRRAKAKGVAFPEIYVEYSNVTVRAKGLVGANALPTLTRTAGTTVQKVLRPGKQKLQEFNVLDDVSGVLKPVRAPPS